MAKRTAAELAIDVTTNASKATAGFDAVGDSAEKMDRSVKAAGDTAEQTSRKLGVTADSADELGGKAGKATGALGALSSGFELVGMEKYAVGLQSASMATDFFSGVGDSLNLVMESTIVKTARARISAIAHSVATKAAAVGTGVMTAAQWALNAAMSASPILLIVIGVVALVAAVVLAYKKSETFRRIVDAAFRAVQRAASFAFNWVKSNWPLLLAIITGPIGLAVLAVVKNWDKIKTAVADTKRFITEKIGQVPAALRSVADTIGRVLSAPFNAVIDLIDKILSKIKSIKLPDIDVPFLRTSTFGSGLVATTGGPSTINYFTISGVIGDRDQLARTIVEVVEAQARRVGG